MSTYTDKRKEIRALSKYLFKKDYVTSECDILKTRFYAWPNYKRFLRLQRKMMARRVALSKVGRGA